MKEYNRNSLTMFLVESGRYSSELKSAMKNVVVPEKFDDNMLSVRTLPPLSSSDAVKAKDWGAITQATKRAVKAMLGLKLQHIGINNENASEASAPYSPMCLRPQPQNSALQNSRMRARN